MPNNYEQGQLTICLICGQIDAWQAMWQHHYTNHNIAHTSTNTRNIFTALLVYRSVIILPDLTINLNRVTKKLYKI